MKRFILGGHSLSGAFILNDYATLFNMMCIVVQNGGKFFELPYLLCELPWKEVARAARAAGIKEIALCHFWPMGADGTPVCGDPLGDERQAQEALGTIDEIIDATKQLRKEGIIVRFVDGPTWGGLAKDYGHLRPLDMRNRVVEFLRQAGDKCNDADLVLAVEFLRPAEDKVIGGTPGMIDILKLVDHPAVRMHFDVFHSRECGENPADMIRLASKWIVYLHLHGDGRLAPGVQGDSCDWKTIIGAVMGIESEVEDIPALPEPFGEETRKDNPALGHGLPDATPFADYLPIAYAKFRQFGLSGY